MSWQALTYLASKVEANDGPLDVVAADDRGGHEQRKHGENLYVQEAANSHCLNMSELLLFRETCSGRDTR